ncbi:glycosyltransferase family 2 protein [Streptomyces litchfieldiae]|uniref:Glycosyltransferase family 2 protein n=1 Tax=Streptomyces litchfieldiae TaxID=3075543 RepID=A0ABU2MSM5_9ACTN|nr:glycosyltransferase family 2 protein [Streptomyces sp. DSM 44938]MDT0343883.1 glycosyltransferase family 2 protein [Streptomyces sp. DSM 44938]
MASEPSLSVIVLCCDVREFLADAVTSLANNARDDFEFLFVDDASTDGTAEVLDAAVRRLPNATVLRQEVNAGPASARNRGIDEARGRYLTFLDGDDWLDRGYLPRLLDIIERHDVDFLRTDHVRVTGLRRTIRRAPVARRDVPLNPRESILPVHTSTMVDYPYSWAGIYHRRLLDRGLLRFPEGLRTAEDRPWIWNLHRRADSFLVPSLYGVFYRRGVATSLTQIGDARQLDFIRAFDQVLADLERDPEADLLRPKAIRNYCAVILHHLRHTQRLERSVKRSLRQLSAQALRRIPHDHLGAALAGMNEERAHTLRRLLGRRGVAA